MKFRKNKKFIDPRYFMNEKMEEQYVQGSDYEDTSDEPTEDSVAAAPGLSTAYMNFGKQFLQSPVASLAPEAAQRARENMAYLPSEDVNDSEYEGSALEAELPGVVDLLLDAAAGYARKHYAEGVPDAGADYMEIRSFLENDLNKMLAYYKLEPIPQTNLWVDVFNPSIHSAATQSTAERYKNGDLALGKILGFTRYARWADGSSNPRAHTSIAR